MGFLQKNIRLIIWIIAGTCAVVSFLLVFNSGAIIDLKYILITRVYALFALGFLYFALLQTPLYSLYPGLPFRALYIRAKRAIGVSAFGFAVLHASFAFFSLLGGFPGLAFLNTRYLTAIILSSTALFILLLMALTSFDAAVKFLGKRWKFLHRFVYLAGFLIIFHFLMIGTNFLDPNNFIAQFVFVAILWLFLLQILRINKTLLKKEKETALTRIGISIGGLILLALWIFLVYGLYAPGNIFGVLSIHSTH